MSKKSVFGIPPALAVAGCQLGATERRDPRETLTDRGVRRMVNARSADTDFGPLVPHKLRSSDASALIEAGVGIDKVMDILGHGGINLTRLYVQRTEEQLERTVKSLPDVVLQVIPVLSSESPI